MVVTIVMVPTVEANPGPGEDPLVVDVTAHQFYWEYTYPNGVVTVDTLRLPVDRPVQLVLDAADVIHSWWVPELTGKRDAIPGRTNEPRLHGLEDRRVRGSVRRALRRAARDHEHAPSRSSPRPSSTPGSRSRAAAQAAGSDPSSAGRRGRAICAKCHGLDGTGGYGPAIAGNSLLTDEQALANLLAEGRDQANIPGYMPPISTGWPDGQLQALIDYLGATPSSPRRGRRREADVAVARRAGARRPRLAARNDRQLADDRRPQAHRPACTSGAPSRSSWPAGSWR